MGFFGLRALYNDGSVAYAIIQSVSQLFTVSEQDGLGYVNHQENTLVGNC
jgi:hypothetical protein